jgi:proteasome accessory factor A
MPGLLFGVETEYAIAGATPRGTIVREEILQGLMERAREQLIQLPDLHSPGGVFLQNGSRFYVDCGLHPEICTPECANPWDAVRYIQAGHSILAGLAASSESAARPGSEIMVFRSNVDYSGAHSTWGCHESYMHRIAQDSLRPEIVPHLVTRLIYTGAGGFNPLSRGLEFTLSPRMAYFQRVVTESSTSERGIWHEKSEPLCADYSRLHVLCGESLCSESATFLKIGVTALIVALADAGLKPGSAIQLADPLQALQSVARDVTCKKPLAMADGRSMTAIEIQRHYLEQVEAHLSNGVLPEWAAEVCERWCFILDDLDGDQSSAEKMLDWRIKQALYANYAKGLGIDWDDLPTLNQAIEQMASAPSSRSGRRKTQKLDSAVEASKQLPNETSELEPHPQSPRVHWTDLGAVMSCREKFFEIDTRFGQLGPKGIFHTLDQAGVLNHRVSGVDNI